MTTTDIRTVILAVEEIPFLRGEPWRLYRRRVESRLAPVRRQALRRMGLEFLPLAAANALHGEATDEALEPLRAGVLGPGVSLVEWGEDAEDVPGDQVHSAFRGVGLGDAPIAPRISPPGLTGRGVSVAVLDSGIDARHPSLEVADAVSTCPEPAGVPGWHGTHCAGLIASRSLRHPGRAPGVRLLDVKVSRAGGWLHPAWLARGIDAALDRAADILSISVGMNRLPVAVAGGHGWRCRGGRCLLCRAADHAVRAGALVVAAVGNEHLRVCALRNRGVALVADAEILCPGGARRVLAVGALETWPAVRLWPHTSRGRGQPALAAPGVDLVSTTPLREEGENDRTTDPLHLFATGSGTSMATAVAAGAAALVHERRRSAGLSLAPHAVRGELLARSLQPLHSIPFPDSE